MTNKQTELNHFRSFKKLAFSQLALFLVLFCTSFDEDWWYHETMHCRFRSSFICQTAKWPFQSWESSCHLLLPV